MVRGKLVLILMICLLQSCEKDDADLIVLQNQLTVSWDHTYGGNTLLGEVPRIYVFDSESEFLKDNGIPVISRIMSVGQIFIDKTYFSEFNDLEYRRYWFKIIYIIPGRYIEHNLETSNNLKYPLIKNTSISVSIPTKRYYYKSLLFKEIDIINSQDNFMFNVGDSITIIIERESKFKSEELYREKNVVNDHSFVSFNIEGSNISNFYSSTPEPRFVINLINLSKSKSSHFNLYLSDILNNQPSFGPVLLYRDSLNNIVYKLHVEWRCEE